MDNQEFYEKLRDLWVDVAAHCVQAINACRHDYEKADRQGWELVMMRACRRAQVYQRKSYGGESHISAEVATTGEGQAKIQELRPQTRPDQSPQKAG